jgi:Ran GTPase-activating protein (RanGAP) involved in mRNA processing and transport
MSSSQTPQSFQAGQRWRYAGTVAEFEPTLFIRDEDGSAFQVVVELIPSMKEELEAQGVIFWASPELLAASGLDKEEESAAFPDWLLEDDLPEEHTQAGEEDDTVEAQLRSRLDYLRSPFWAISADQENRLRRILAANPDAARDPAALYRAIGYGNLPIIQLLLEHGADASAVFEGTTPLHFAAKLGYSGVTEFLLSHGANLEARDADGWTAAAHAAWLSSKGYENGSEILEQLLARGAVLDLNSLLRLGRLDETRERLAKDVQTIHQAPQPQLLIHNLLDYLVSIPEDQETPWSEVLHLLRLLIEQGINPNHLFPLELAVRLPDPCVARLLLEAGADPNQKAAEGRFLQPRGEAMRSLLRSFGAKSRNDPEIVLRERGAVRDEDESDTDRFMMRIEGRVSLMHSTAEEKARLRYARASLEVGQYERALRFVEKVVARDAGDILAQLLRAWILSTCPEERLRDGELALRLAYEAKQSLLSGIVVWACDGSGEQWQDPAPQQALAAALAELGNFPKALKILNEVDLEEVSPIQRQRIERMRACFEAGRPYREEPADPELLELGERLAEEEGLSDADSEEEFVLDESGGLYIHRQGFGVEGVRRLLASPRLAEVTSLKIKLSALSDAEVLLLAEELIVPHLTALDLSINRIRDKGGAALLAVQRWPELRELTLYHNQLGRRTAEAIAGNSALVQLTKLNLARNHLRTPGVAALAASPYLGSLEELNLEDNAIRDEGLRLLAASTALPNLKILRLMENDLSAQGVAALAQSPLLAGLTVLELDNNRLEDNALRALAGAAKGRLEKLNLARNRIGSAGAAALADAPLLDSVRELILYNNPIGPEGIQALASSRHVANLETLQLQDAMIDEAAATVLAESDSLKQLRTLHISHDGVSEAAQAILRQRFGTGLRF